MGFFWQQDSSKAHLFLLHIFLIISAITILIGVLCWLFALPVVLLLGGEQFTESAELLRWMAPLPFFAAMTNFYGVQIMLGKGRYRSFNVIIVVASVISLASVYPLVTWMGTLGAVYNLLLLELILAVGTASYVLRHQLLGASTNA
jgi:O-antigen/teichoic acid export membrane protein